MACRALVSVNIPTLNSARTLENCLLALNRQSYPEKEVIVIDSYSSDETVKVARNHTVRLFLERGLTKQRLRGITESKGDYILLLDSDQIVASNLIEQCVMKLQSNPDLDGLVIPEMPETLSNDLIGRAQSSYLKLFQNDMNVFKGTSLPRFFRASVLKKILPPRYELGYFDHAWIYSRVSRSGANIAVVNSSIQHLEFNSTGSVAKKFFKYYGGYLAPMIIEDWKLLVGKVLPKVSTLSQSSNGNRFKLVLLFGVKAVSTIAGALTSPIRLSIFSITHQPVSNNRG